MVLNYCILDDFDWENLEKGWGNRGDFSESAMEAQTPITKHFNNLNNYKLHLWFHSKETQEDVYDI